MGRPETKKNLQGDIPTSLHDALTGWISTHRDIKIRQVLAGMVEMWLALGEETQALLLFSPGVAQQTHFLSGVSGDLPNSEMQQKNTDLYIALAEYLETQPVGLSPDLSRDEQRTLDSLRATWDDILDALGLGTASLPQRLRRRFALSEATTAAIAEATLDDAEAIEAGQPCKTGGTHSKSPRSGKSRGRGRKAG